MTWILRKTRINLLTPEREPTGEDSGIDVSELIFRLGYFLMDSVNNNMKSHHQENYFWAAAKLCLEQV